MLKIILYWLIERQVIKLINWSCVF